MNKLKYILCIILIAILGGGCAFNNTSKNNFEQNQGHVTVTNNLEENDAWKKDIAARLLKEFYNFYDLRKKDGSRMYHSVLAADRAIALLGVYRDYVPENDLNFIESKKEELTRGLASSKIRFGYTESGLHILALLADFTSGSDKYIDLCNDLRKIDSENEFFHEMYFTGSKNRAYMCDIYVEDLRGIRETVNMDVEFFEIPGNVVIPKKNAFSSKEMDILKKYHRMVDNSNTEFKIGEWNLFALGYVIYRIEVNVDNETIMLQ